MTNFYDPQGADEIWRAKFATATEEFQAGAISEDVFRASLYALGYRGQGLACEFRHQDQLKFERGKNEQASLSVPLRAGLSYR